MLFEAEPLGELEAPLELLGAAPRELLNVSDIRERIDEDLGIVDLLREIEGPRSPVDRSFGVLEVHVQVREIAIRHRELAAWREPLECGHGVAANLHRLLRSADVPQQSRQRAKRVSFAALVAELSVTFERAPLRVDRVVELAGDIASV